jgi:DNA polymerase V
MNAHIRTALVDCDNFFVSCERLFRPDLYRTPVVVLSSNDACVISRSEEVKRLGVPMGAPYFKIQNLCSKHNIVSFSSNFELYRDISQRVMSVLSRFSDNMEVYSIDEAFLTLHVTKTSDAVIIGKEIRDTVYKEVGIPISIGISLTKTLAKVAGHYAKPKQQGLGYIALFTKQERDDALTQLPIGEVWGVGRRLAPKLERLGIKTAYDLTQTNQEQIRKQTSISLVYTAIELKGKHAFATNGDSEVRKSLMHSQSFGGLITDTGILSATIAHHARVVSDMLRNEHIVARTLTVFVYVRTLRNKRLIRKKTSILEAHTNSMFTIAKCALSMLSEIKVLHGTYTKAGVHVTDIVPEGCLPKENLFGDDTQRDKTLMRTIDILQSTFKNALQLGAELQHTKATAKRARLSPRYTTRWNELAQLP